jgi:2-methylcitrate dehydratase
MSKIKFVHGGKEFDDKYPEGIPTQVDIVFADGKKLSSGLIMFPSGHARNTSCNLQDILNNKNNTLLSYAVNDKKKREDLLNRLNNFEKMNNKDLENLYNCEIEYSSKSIDEDNFDYSKYAK